MSDVVIIACIAAIAPLLTAINVWMTQRNYDKNMVIHSKLEDVYALTTRQCDALEAEAAFLRGEIVGLHAAMAKQAIDTNTRLLQELTIRVERKHPKDVS